MNTHDTVPSAPGGGVNSSFSRTRKMVMLSIMAAFAYGVMVVGRIPLVLFLKYDPKDIVITIAGFIFGPLSAFMVSLVVSFLEMLTVSETGPIGFVMNMLSSCAFACTASYIYSKNRTKAGAVIGLVAGLVLGVIVMMLWNYFVVPLYMVGTSRQDVAAMLLPVFLPFNVLKHGLNMGFTLLLYKPLVGALRKSNLIPEEAQASAGKLSTGTILLGGGILVTCIMFVLVIRGII